MQALRAMNNPTKYLISFALLCLSNVAISEEIVFSINCKILDQVVLEVVDGESKRYTGFGDVKIGDKTSITFKFEERATAGSYRITYENDQSGQASVKQSIQNSSYNHIMENGRIIFKHMIRGSGEKTIALGQSYIRLAGNSGASITGRRYFKNDWGFIAQGGIFTDNYMQALNCMNVPEAYDQMLQKIRDFHKVNPESINR